MNTKRKSRNKKRTNNQRNKQSCFSKTTFQNFKPHVYEDYHGGKPYSEAC